MSTKTQGHSILVEATTSIIIGIAAYPWALVLAADMARSAIPTIPHLTWHSALGIVLISRCILGPTRAATCKAGHG